MAAGKVAALVVTEEVEADLAETGEADLEVIGEAVALAGTVVDLMANVSALEVTAVVLGVTEEAVASVTGEETVDLATGEATEEDLATDPAEGSRDWTFKETAKKRKGYA